MWNKIEPDFKRLTIRTDGYYYISKWTKCKNLIKQFNLL